MIYDIEEIRSIYKDLFEYSLDLIFVNKLNGDFLDANDILLKTFGLKREDIPQYSLSDIMDKDQLTKAYKSLTELKKTGRQSNMMEFRINGKDGITIYVDAYVIPLYKNAKIYATLGIARNITDLKRARNRLERSEEKYRFLYETTPYSIILLNSEGIVVDCNPTTELMFGYIKDELVGRHFKNISAIHQKYIPTLIELFPKHIEGDVIDPIDIQIYHKNGKLMWVNTQASIINLSGNLFVQVTFHDITDKKVISQKLEESRNLYRTLVKTSPDAIIVTDLKGKIIEVSENIIELSGGNSIEDVIGINSFDLISPHDIPKAMEDHQKALKGNNPIKSEFTVNRLDGIQFIGELNTSVLRNNDGTPKAFIGIMRDITEQKNAENLLKESEEQYRDLYQNALACLWTVRIQDTKIIRANNVSTEYTGVKSLEELIDKYYVSDFFEPDVIRDIYKKLKISGEISGVETQFKDLMGNEKILSFWAKLYPDKGIIEGAFIDITNVKLVQKALQESEEKYRHLFENSPNMIILLDSDGRILDVNTPFLNIFGFEEDEVIGKDFQQLPTITLNALSVFKNKFNEIFSEGVLDPFELQVVVKGKILRWMNIQGSLIDIEGKKILQAIFQDINERKEAEQKLKESEEKYRIISENANDLIILIDENFKLEYINEETHKRVAGYSKEEIIGTTPLDRMHPEDINKVLKAYRNGATSGIGLIEFRYRKKDGTWMWLESLGKRFFDNKGEAKGLIISRDISERKISEQKLRESEEKYRTLMENIPQRIFLKDKNSVYISCNNNYAIDLKIRADEIIGKTDYDFYPKELADKYRADDKRIISTGEAEEMDEFDILNGIKRYVRTIKTPIRDNSGNTTGLIGIFWDITKRREAEEKLRESEEKYRHLFENSSSMIMLLDSSGKIFAANTFFLKIFNYEEVDLIGKNFQQLENISLKNLSIYEEKFKDIFATGILEPFELQVEVKDDFFRWMTIQGSIIDIEGKKLLQVIFQDINERKEAEQKLKESEAKYRLITDNANDLISVIDENFRHEFINEEVHLKLTGYSSEDLIGFSPVKNVHSEDIKKGVKAWRTGVISGEGSVEVRYKKKDGTWMWLEIRGKKYTDFKGKPKGILVSRDITKRKIAEQKLKESEQKYRHLFESSPYSIGLLDLEGTLIESNNATTKFTSTRTTDELIGKNFREIFSSTEQDRSILPKLTEYIKEVIKYEIREPLEIPITRSNGNVMWISFYGSLIKIGDKSFLQFLGLDITDRKRAEQNLKKSEKKYRLLFENSPNAIILANIKGIILDFNHVYEKLLGFKRDELIGKNYTEIAAPDHVNIMRKRYEDHLKGKILKPMEIEFSKLDGSRLWLNYQNKIIKLDEEDISISIIQDITKRKEAELLVKEELIKLKELDQIRKDLISRVSHELKTPLIPVISGTELLTTIYKDQIGEDALEIIEMIDNGGARLKELVEKLINVSRIEYNKFEVRKETFNLSEIIKRSANGMKFLMEQRRLNLKCEIPDNLYLEIDELRIEEVITNLLSNAIKNTPPHGEINLNLRKEGNWAILTVSDTGVGLTVKEKNVLFTRFGKIERYEKGLEDIDVKGSGLGLYICKEIISLHEGKIWAESEGRNKGSSFNVKLPI